MDRELTTLWTSKLQAADKTMILVLEMRKLKKVE